MIFSIDDIVASCLKFGVQAAATIRRNVPARARVLFLSIFHVSLLHAVVRRQHEWFELCSIPASHMLHTRTNEYRLCASQCSVASIEMCHATTTVQALAYITFCYMLNVSHC